MSFWSERVLPPAIEWVCASRGPSKNRVRVVPQARGRVLDIGSGSGLNLAHARADHIEQWVGIDPSEALIALAQERAQAAPFEVRLLRGHAESLPFEDSSFDSVVITYTYCSVEDPVAALRELTRVLKVGGRLLFAEHGLARSRGSREIQRRLDPAWRWLAGGCSLQRDLAAELASSAAFSLEEVHQDDHFPRWMSTVTTGTAIRRD